MKKLTKTIMPAMIPIGMTACAHTHNTSFVENSNYFPADRESEFVKERVYDVNGDFFGTKINYTDIKGDGTEERDNYFEVGIAKIDGSKELIVSYQEGSFAKYVNAFDTTELPGYELLKVVEITEGGEIARSYQMDFDGEGYSMTNTDVKMINLPGAGIYFAHFPDGYNSSILNGRRAENASTLFDAVNSIGDAMEEGNIETRILLGYDESFEDELNVLLGEGKTWK